MVVKRELGFIVSKVAIIIPCFNVEKYISATLDSVLKQTFDDFEIIVVDGGSTDKTLKILLEFKRNNKNIKIINNQNDLGPAHSRLVGIKASESEYIAFLDADDLWFENKLELQINKMIADGLDFTFTDYLKINDDGIILPGVISGHNSNSYKEYLRRRGIANSTVIIRREIIGDVWDGNIHKSHSEDTLWWLLLMKDRGIKSYRVDECLCKYRISEKGLSRKILKNQTTIWHSYRNELGLNIYACLYYYPLYILDVLTRRIKYKFFSKKL